MFETISHFAFNKCLKVGVFSCAVSGGIFEAVARNDAGHIRLSSVGPPGVRSKVLSAIVFPGSAEASN